MGDVFHILHSVCILEETAHVWSVVYGGAEDTNSEEEPETCPWAIKKKYLERDTPALCNLNYQPLPVKDTKYLHVSYT